jgi:hypothetical protein
VDHWKKRANGWVFISHSSDDYDNVRAVRNYLEDSGFSALMFYLKSLEDDDKKQHIKTLIEWEIQSRNIFVLCDSEFSRASTWVQWETEYVKKLSNKLYRTIDIERFKEGDTAELSKLNDLISKGTLYLTYAQADEDRILPVREKLKSLGYKIFDGVSSFGQDQFSDGVMSDAFSQTLDKGVIIIFLSHNAKQSKWFWDEKSEALHTGAFIIPVVLDDVNIDDFPAFRHTQYVEAINKKPESVIQQIESAIAKSNDGM